MKVTLVHKDVYIPDFDFKDVSQVPMEIANALWAELNSYVPKKYDSAPNWIQPTWSRWKTLLRILLSWKETDVLVLFHIEKFTILAAWLYKISNPRGFVYVKGDFNWHGISVLDRAYAKNPWAVNAVMKAYDFISYENEEHASILRKVLSYVPIAHIRNAPSFDVFESSPNFSAKKPVFLAVWRLWYEEAKRFSLILKAALDADFERWFEIRLIGETEGNWFDFIKENSDAIEQLRLKKIKVNVLWPIQDRRRLMSHYKECSFFLISSVSEGSPLVVPEAMHNGCILVSTDVWTVKHDYPKEGLILSDWNPTQYGEAMKAALRWYEMTTDADKVALMTKLTQHCKKWFTWRKQLEPVITSINMHYAK